MAYINPWKKPYFWGTPGDEEIGREVKHSSGGKKSLEAIFEEAKRLQKLGIDGDKKAVIKAYETLEDLRKKIKENQLVEAYYGSVIALMGRDAIDPMERFEKAMKGLKILDKAVAHAPEHTEIRALRGYVSFRLPEMYFHRTKTAIEDFSYLADRYEEDIDVFSKEFYWQILYDLGVAHKNLNQKQDAESVWTKLLSQDPAVKYKKLLKQEGFQVDLPQSHTYGAKRDENLNKGKELHRMALAGDKHAARTALNHFKKNVNDDPSDRLSQAYQADCMSLLGRDSMDTREMFANAIKAMKTFDEAVNYSPDDVEIRLLRANHSLRLPESFFCRTTTAITDLEHLVELYHEDHSIFTAETYWQVLYDLGRAYQRMNMEQESQAAWEKLMSLDPGTKYRELIDAQRVDDIFVTKGLRTQQDYFMEGFRLHDLGVAGNRKATKLALDLWEKIYNKIPEDSTAEAYYGSCLALDARDSTNTGNVFRNTILGLKHINNAVERDEHNLRIRTIRAYLLNALPECFFQMTEKAIKDFKYLKYTYEQDHSSFDQELYHQILYDLGVAYERINEHSQAKKVWKKLLKESDEPKYRELLRGRV